MVKQGKHALKRAAARFHASAGKQPSCLMRIERRHRVVVSNRLHLSAANLLFLHRASFRSCSDRQLKYAVLCICRTSGCGLGFCSLPAFSLPIDQTADHLHDQGIDRMGTAEARGNDGPVFHPANAVFYSHPDGPQLPIEGFLLFGQLAPFGLLEGGVDLQAGDLLFFARLGITHRDQGHLFGQALVAFIRVHFASIGQAFQRVELIAQQLVVHCAGYRFTDGFDVVLPIRDKLGLAYELFLLARIVFLALLTILRTVDLLLRRIHPRASVGQVHQFQL